MDGGLIVLSERSASITDRRWLHADERGSIVAISDATGAAIVKNSYDEYGLPGPATNDGRFQYTGQLWIPEIQLYYYKARFYDPRLGRFMQTDPIGYDGGMNLYAYVGDDPVNFVDPLGQDFQRGDSLGGWTKTTFFGSTITYHYVEEYQVFEGVEKHLSYTLTGISYSWNQFGDRNDLGLQFASLDSSAGRGALASEEEADEGCIPLSAGPVYIDESYGFDVGLVVGAGISFSHFKIPSTGDSGWVASGSFLGGAGLSLGGSVGIVENLGGLLGEGFRMGAVSPIPNTGVEWSFGDDGRVNGVSGGPALGAAIFGGKTKTKLQSSTRPVCE